MTLRKAMMFALMIGGIALNAVPATAQDNAEEDREQLLIAGTVDCRYQLRPAEVAICGTPVLAAMDLQMTTLFNILNLLVKQETALEMAATQQQFPQGQGETARPTPTASDRRMPRGSANWTKS